MENRSYRLLIRSLFAFSLLIVAGAGAFSLRANDRRIFIRRDPGHYNFSLGEASLLDWTEGYVLSHASARLPRIVFNPESPDYGMPDTERTITDARARAREEAHDSAAARLTDALLELPLDARYTIREKMNQDGSLRDRMGHMISRFLVASRRTGEGYVSVDLAIPLYGPRGLYELLLPARRGKMEVPVVGELAVEDRVTGLIVDVSHIPVFQPALFPEIYTDRGRKIYSPEMVREKQLLNRGPVAYYTSPEEARRDPRLGIAPYYVEAAGVLGKNQSNVFLDLEDAARILSCDSGREALKNGAVVFIVASMKGRSQ